MIEDDIELNEGHLLEALDRVYVATDYIERTLLEHSLILSVPEFREKVEQASSLLGELYQAIGQYDSIEEITNKLKPE